MAVLVEALTVVIRREALEARFPGGAAGFKAQAPNRTFRMDAHFAAVGFMDPQDVRACNQWLAAMGLIQDNEDESARDFVLAQQTHRNFTVPCDWAEIYLAYLDDDSDERTMVICKRPDENFPLSVETPEDWVWEDSLSRKIDFIPLHQIEQRLIPVGNDLTTDAFIDRETGELCYVGRTRR